MNSIVKEKRYISEKLGVPYESLSQSYLRAETLIQSTTVLNWTLQRNKAKSTTPTERLLDLNDEFVITDFFVGYKTTQQENPTDDDHIRAFVKTYEGSITPTTFAKIYNASLNFTIDRTEFIPNFPVRAFRRVPFQQQFFDGTGAPIDAGWDGYTNGKYGFANSEPTKIDGRQTLDLSIDGGGVNFTAVSGGFAIFEARGYLITNAK